MKKMDDRKKAGSKSKKVNDLRKRAEKKIPVSMENVGDISDMKVQKLVHELQVHQIELEMQNEALQKAQMELTESHRKYADLYDFAPVGYFTLDNKGHIIETNVTGADLLGSKKRSLIGQPFHRFIVTEYFSIFQSHLQKAVELRNIRICKLKLVKRDGGSFDALIETMAVINGEGRLDHYRSSIIDISDMAQVEMALKKRTVELEVANKELESFSYSVSHDLRAPLRAIDGYARIILKKQGDEFDEDTLRKFNEIRLNAQKMGQLVDDLLAFSRLGRTHMSMSKIGMDQLVREVWKELQTVNPDRNMELTSNGIAPGYGDRALIKQVYVNLISNAVKFTRNRNAAHIEAGGYTDGNEYVFYVKDNGVGFDMTYYSKLFGVFQRLHSDYDFEGTGVGLALVQRIIHMHGGRVWAEGKVNEGATFYFTLPHNGD
jgi:chemotaxis family two-component system sensor kinase Cph1